MHSRSVRGIFVTTLVVLACTGSFGHPGCPQVNTHRAYSQVQTRDELLVQANDLDNRAKQLYKAEKYQDALPLARRVLELRELALGPNEDLVGTSAVNVAMLYKALKDDNNALTYFQQALGIVEKIYGPDHYRVGVCRFELAQIAIRQRRYDESRPLLDR